MELIVTDTISYALDRLHARLADKKPVAEAVGLAIVGLTVRSFNDPSVRAAAWAPLSPITIARKMEEGTSSAVLKRHGLLFRSWRVTKATNDYVRVGSDRFYAMFHQFGTKRDLPARPMLPIVGSAEHAKLTPLAVKGMTSAATATLRALMGGA